MGRGMFQPGVFCICRRPAAWKVPEKLRWNFGKLKISFDVTLTTTAIVISLVSLSALRGVREGTVAGAFCVGTLVALLMPRLRFARKLCYVRK